MFDLSLIHSVESISTRMVNGIHFVVITCKTTRKLRTIFAFSQATKGLCKLKVNYLNKNFGLRSILMEKVQFLQISTNVKEAKKTFCSVLLFTTSNTAIIPKILDCFVKENALSQLIHLLMKTQMSQSYLQKKAHVKICFKPKYLRLMTKSWKLQTVKMSACLMKHVFRLK